MQEKTLYRVALLSDRHIIGGAELKLASHCGGIMPYSPWLQHCKGTSACADPGNPTYGEIVMMLFSKCFPWRHNDIGVTTAEELWEYDMKTEEELIHYRFECLKQLTLTTPTRLSRSCPGPTKICKEEFGELATSPLRSANRFDGWVPPSLASPWQTFWKSTTEASQSLWQRLFGRGRQYMVTRSARHPPHGTRPCRAAAR